MSLAGKPSPTAGSRGGCGKEIKRAKYGRALTSLEYRTSKKRLRWSTVKLRLVPPARRERRLRVATGLSLTIRNKSNLDGAGGPESFVCSVDFQISKKRSSFRSGKHTVRGRGIELMHEFANRFSGTESAENEGKSVAVGACGGHDNVADGSGPERLGNDGCGLGHVWDFRIEEQKATGLGEHW